MTICCQKFLRKQKKNIILSVISGQKRKIEKLFTETLFNVYLKKFSLTSSEHFRLQKLSAFSFFGISSLTRCLFVRVFCFLSYSSGGKNFAIDQDKKKQFLPDKQYKNIKIIVTDVQFFSNRYKTEKLLLRLNKIFQSD